MLRLVVAVALAVCLSSVADAQPRLIVSGQGPQAIGSPSATMSVNLGTLGTEWFYPTPWVDPIITADGRYVVAWPVASPATELLLYDLVSGALTTLPLGGHTLARAVAHTRRFEVYGLMTDGLVAGITLNGLRPLLTCADARALDLSGDNRRLVLVCGSEIVVADADSGAEIARFSSIGVHAAIADVDGSRVMVDRAGDLAVFDVATGSVVVEHITPALGSTEDVLLVLAPTPARDAVLVSTDIFFFVGNYGHRSLLIDFDTLAVRQSLPLVGLGICKVGLTTGECPAPFDAVFTADGRYVIAGTRDTLSAPPKPARGSMVQIVDLPSNALVLSSGPDFFATNGLTLALGSAPLPPVNLHATVTGGTVTLSWDLAPTSPAVTCYVVEAGSAPGLANLAVLTVSGTPSSLVVPGVPPGRYYVRVRGVNATGRGTPSADLLVEVP